MNKKGDTQNSTDRFMKSKYAEKEKQKTIPIVYNTQAKKVMLTDLCPQEKAKIGELIKTLETRKLENEQLQDEIRGLRSKFNECQSKLMEIENLFTEKERQCVKLNDKIQRLEEKNMENEIVNDKMRLEMGYQKEIIEKFVSIKKENRGVGTDSVLKIDFSIQTKEKKLKRKNRGVQVQMQERKELSPFYRPHSKSFEKIMKGNFKEEKHASTDSRKQYNSFEKQSNLKIEDEQEEYNKNNQEDMEEQFDDLAKKWLKLKEKNMSKLKLQYQNSKAKFFKEDKHFLQPKQFSDQEDDDEIVQAQKSSEIADIDENQLNRMLKGKNFSASRLLNNKMSQSQSSRKGLPQKQSIETLGPRGKVQKIPEGYYEGKIKNILQIGRKNQASKRGESSDRHINFYESDLLELVDSMNQ